ncbi:hypothetical protein KR093_001840, partial [Drosophila rubida]
RLYADYLWIGEYMSDIYNTMKESQLNREPIRFASTQVEYRPMLIQLCATITRWFNLSPVTLHLGVYYLDRIMDSYCIQPDKLQLIAVTCVRVAAQMEHRQVPRNTDIDSIILPARYAPFEYKAVQRMVLKHFKFDLLQPTTVGFVELLTDKFVTPADYVAYIVSLNKDPLGKAIKFPRFINYEQMLYMLAPLLPPLADYTLNFHKYSNEPPS